jgi:type II secretory pathway pseudopilin PulG
MRELSIFRRKRAVSRRAERGYILLTLMLMCSLILIGLAAVAPQITQQLKRDREEELIHRGVQYSRAIRKFYKKTGRYPVRLEELENTNNLRFLRHRYKDPVTGEDFKLLHFGEVQMFTGGGIAGALPAGVPAGALAAAANMQTGGANNMQAQLASQVQNQMIAQTAMMSAAGASSMNSPAAGGATGPGATGSSSPFSSSAAGAGGQTFGGGPIVGVVSTSKKESIRQFNKKNHYKDWQFIYDPGTDRGGLLNTPAQPPLKAPASAQGQPGTPGQPGQPGAGFGGMQGTPMQPPQGLNPTPPPQPPQQQQ